MKIKMQTTHVHIHPRLPPRAHRRMTCSGLDVSFRFVEMNLNDMRYACASIIHRLNDSNVKQLFFECIIWLFSQRGGTTAISWITSKCTDCPHIGPTASRDINEQIFCRCTKCIHCYRRWIVRMSKSTPIGIHSILLAFFACSRSKFEIKWFFFALLLFSARHERKLPAAERNRIGKLCQIQGNEFSSLLRFTAPTVSENKFHYFRFTVPCYKITFCSTFSQVTDIRWCDCFSREKKSTAFASWLQFSVGVVTAIACGQNCSKNRVTNALK